MTVTFIRTLILYSVIVFGMRLMGKRQLGELQPSELVLTILISNIATLPIEDTNVPLLGGVVPIVTLVCFEVIISMVNLKSDKVRKMVSGNPMIIIRDGTIDQAVMLDLRFSLDDLMEQLRVNGIFDISDVAFAIVETTGKVSVYPKFEARPLTPKMLGMNDQPAENSPPVTLISDGKVVPDSLQYCNLKPEWLEKTLRDNKCT